MVSPRVGGRAWAMLAATLNAGIADAVGYLALDRVFTANQTGNVVLVGLAIGGQARAVVLGPLVALGCFILGAAVTGWLLYGERSGWSRRITGSFVAEAVVLAATAIGLLNASRSSTGLPRRDLLVITGMALAMGIQAATARKVGVKGVVTVVVTSSMTSFLVSLRGGLSRVAVSAGLAPIAMVAGAALGALLFQVDAWIGAAAAATITASIALVGHRRLRETGTVDAG